MGGIPFSLDPMGCGAEGTPAPDTYTLYDYIEASGGASINTDIIMRMDYSLDTYTQLLSITYGAKCYCYFVYFMGTSDGLSYQFTTNAGGVTIANMFITSRIASIGSPTDYKNLSSSNWFKKNALSKTATTATWATAQKTWATSTSVETVALRLLMTSGTYNPLWRLWTVTIKDSTNIIIHCLKPAVRDADSVVGMLDTVTNVFYPKSGTGTLTVGNDPIIRFD